MLMLRFFFFFKVNAILANGPEHKTTSLQHRGVQRLVKKKKKGTRRPIT